MVKKCIQIEDDGETARAHFLVHGESILAATDSVTREDKEQDIDLHAEAMRRIVLLRKLLPSRQSIGCQGYGHIFDGLDFPYDPTRQPGVAVTYLPPEWAIRVNSIFRQRATYSHRPQHWQTYIAHLLELRVKNLDRLRELRSGLDLYFRKHARTDLFNGSIAPKKWDETRWAIYQPLLPQSAVDEWGLAVEENERRRTETQCNTSMPQFLHKEASALQRYQSSLKAMREFLTPLSNFYNQATRVIPRNTHLGRLNRNQNHFVMAQLCEEQGCTQHLVRLSIHNFAEALQHLDAFQISFRACFKDYVDAQQLCQLEQREREELPLTWTVWYQFALHPGRQIQHATQEAATRFETCLRQQRIKLRRRFKQLQREQASQIEILSKSAPWKQASALWIAINVDDPVTRLDNS